MRRLAALLITAALWPDAATAQERESLFNGTDSKHWKSESAKARVRDGAIRLQSSDGWLRTERTFADFVLTLDVRMPSGGTAGVFICSWPKFGTKKEPTNVYRLTATFPKATAETEAWARWEIECKGRAVRMRINGELAFSSDATMNPLGFVALWSKDGTAEFRNVEIREIVAPPSEIDRVVTFTAPGLTRPRLVREVKASYTQDALQRGLHGAVVVAAIIERDGTIRSPRVVQSLDPRYGLDKAALEAAQMWMFTPGTLDGAPVRVHVVIELFFSLK